MKTDIQFFNSIDAAKILGVNVSTIKRWTEEGKLECIKTAGGHRKFLMHQLADFVEKHKKLQTKVSLFPVEVEHESRISYHILKGDFEFLIDYVSEQALAANRDQIQQVFKGLYLAQYPLYQIYDQLVTPLLHRVGLQWVQGNLSVIQEHIISFNIRDSIIRLQGIINLPTDKIGKAFCMTMSNDLHDIALKMVDHLLETAGYQVFNSGQRTPSLHIEKIFENYRPDMVFISSTFVQDLNSNQAEFDKICYISQQYQAKVYIGGLGFEKIDFDHPAVVKRFYSFEELYLHLQQTK